MIDIAYIDELPEYYFTRDGRVFTTDFRGTGKTRELKRYLSKQKGKQYYSVKVRGWPRQVHRLICEAFHGKPPEGKSFALHRDDVKTNNHADNLYWGSIHDNAKDAVANKRLAYGTKNHRSKITEKEVREIRESKLSGPKLAEKYGLHNTTIYRIKSGKYWGDTTND